MNLPKEVIYHAETVPMNKVVMLLTFSSYVAAIKP